MIELREVHSKKIDKLRRKEELLSSKFPLDENMDKVNWKRIRRVVDVSAKLHKIPRKLNIKVYKKSGLKFETITPKKLTNDDIIIYFHGGGFVLGNIVYTRHFTTALAEKSGSVVVSVEYPLGPDNTIVDIMNNVSSVYDLISIKHPNSNISLIGTSAGGCIALALALKINKENKKPLHSLVLYSPLTDLSESYKNINEITDKVIPKTCKKGCRKVILGKYKKKDMYASPLLYVGNNLPKTLIAVDNNESLFTDSYILYNKCLENNITSKLILYKNTYHAFQTLANKTKETKELLEITNEFIKG
ncbi:MAG: alpha/beta hydrolase [Bacilli bacterium]|nr:alpha/beta hydrolase [Bacilli bacterium]